MQLLLGYHTDPKSEVNCRKHVNYYVIQKQDDGRGDFSIIQHLMRNPIIHVYCVGRDDEKPPCHEGEENNGNTSEDPDPVLFRLFSGDLLVLPVQIDPDDGKGNSDKSKGNSVNEAENFENSPVVFVSHACGEQQGEVLGEYYNIYRNKQDVPYDLFLSLACSELLYSHRLVDPVENIDNYSCLEHVSIEPGDTSFNAKAWGLCTIATSPNKVGYEKGYSG